MVLGADGGLWFTDPEGDRVWRVGPDGDTWEPRQLPAGSRPTEIVAAPDGRILFTLTGGIGTLMARPPQGDPARAASEPAEMKGSAQGQRAGAVPQDSGGGKEPGPARPPEARLAALTVPVRLSSAVTRDILARHGLAPRLDQHVFSADGELALLDEQRLENAIAESLRALERCGGVEGWLRRQVDLHGRFYHRFTLPHPVGRFSRAGAPEPTRTLVVVTVRVERDGALEHEVVDAFPGPPSR